MKALVVNELVNGRYEPTCALRGDGTVLGQGPTATDLRKWARRTGLIGEALLQRGERAWTNGYVAAVIVDLPSWRIEKDFGGAGGTMTGGAVSTPTYGGGLRRRMRGR